jgi:3-hydroxyisobutyrate dehydrogenase-like beta-hydroxyacid dehydrogenase
MNENTEQSVGIINPGAMGISVAATMINSGHRVCWASAGRSEQSESRAAEHDLIDLHTTAELVQQCDFLVSVCPPHAAEEVAYEAIDRGFQGLYLDANAISPRKARRIEARMREAGIIFVDGGIIGGPAWEPGRTWLYLSGEDAEEALPLFAAGPLETEIVGAEIGQASALKMVFAAYTKGNTALLALVLAGAESLDVRQPLEKQWSRYWPDFTEETHQRLRRVTAKAWRFEGEMHEIASTFAGVDLPRGFHTSAEEIYRRLASFKDAGELPDLDTVLDALQTP